MNDVPSSEGSATRSWLNKLSASISGEPQNKDELLNIIKDAHQRQVLDHHAFSMIEGALEISDLQVGDIMVPRSQAVMVQVSDKIEKLLPQIIESGHSRFPVLGEDQDEVLGILLAKDLLPLTLLDNNARKSERFSIREHLRSPMLIPQSKRIDVILREFRDTHSHMAVVVNEYGAIAGIITIEDVLEQIVGEIEDETDIEEDDFPVNAQADGSFIIKALMPLDAFNDYFSSQLSDEKFNTIGGAVTHVFGHVPKREESTSLGNLHFEIISADSRAVKLLKVTRLK